VVKRSEQKDSVRTLVIGGESSSVADLGGDASSRPAKPFRVLDVAGQRIDDVHRVAIIRQPGGMGASAAADVEDVEWSNREVSSDDLLGAHELEPPCASVQSLSFNDLEVVVVLNFGRWLHHGPRVRSELQTVRARFSPHAVPSLGGGSARVSAKFGESFVVERSPLTLTLAADGVRWP